MRLAAVSFGSSGPATRSRALPEVGYLPCDRAAANMVFQLISRRYERGSIILTSNKAFSEWGQVFTDDVLATAILDRLLHHANVVAINGPSYRLKDRTLTPAGAAVPIVTPPDPTTRHVVPRPTRDPVLRHPLASATARACAARSRL